MIPHSVKSWVHWITEIKSSAFCDQLEDSLQEYWASSSDLFSDYGLLEMFVCAYLQVRVV